MNNDWKDRLGIVFSTNPDFQYETQEETETPTLPNHQQKLKVRMERASRKGKTVTLVEGYRGTSDDLKALEKLLKNKCGVGGSSKDSVIIIQGEAVERVKAILISEGYNVK